MQALVKSTWLAVGPNRDSLLRGSQNNTEALPAPLALLWSSNLMLCPLTAIQSHLTVESCLWSLKCQSISLGNKANCFLGPTVFFEFLHSLPLCFCFIYLDCLIRIWKHSWVCQTKTNNVLSLHNVPPPLLTLLIVFVFSWHFKWLNDHSKNAGVFYALHVSQESWKNRLNYLPGMACFIFRQYHTHWCGSLQNLSSQLIRKNWG